MDYGVDLKREACGRPGKRSTPTVKGVDFLLKRNAQLTSILREGLPPINRPAAVRGPGELRVEDLLPRNPVKLDVEKIRAWLENKVLLITGGGGSIGAELVRQVASFSPEKLILLERSENGLVRISRELSAVAPGRNFVPVVGDVLDTKLREDVFALHRPNSVFHAAAYKHVPMMERNCFQAVSPTIFSAHSILP